MEYLLSEDVRLPAHIEQWRVQRDRVYSLAVASDSTVLPILFEASENSEHFIRAEAAFLLQHFDQPEVRKRLQILAQDSDNRVQMEAALALKAISRRRRQSH